MDKKAETIAVLTAACDLVSGLLITVSGNDIAEGLSQCKKNDELIADVCLAVIQKKLNKGEVSRVG